MRFCFLSLSLVKARQLLRQREPRKRKSFGCLAEGSKRAKSILVHIGAPGAVATGDGGVVCAFLSLPQPRWSSTAPSSEGVGKKSAGCLAEGSERAKINFFALQDPHVRGAVAPVGCGKTVLSLSAAPSRIEKKRVAEAFEDVMLFYLGEAESLRPGYKRPGSAAEYRAYTGTELLCLKLLVQWRCP